MGVLQFYFRFVSVYSRDVFDWFHFCDCWLQAYAAEAGAERAEEPMEEAGMSDEIIQKAGNVH